MEFLIGQRVRVVAPGSLHGKTATVYDIQRPANWFERLFGSGTEWSDCSIRQGVHPKETAYLLDVDGIGKHFPFEFGRIASPYYWLRPLEDPKADEFIERIKKLEREPIVAPPVTVKA